MKCDGVGDAGFAIRKSVVLKVKRCSINDRIIKWSVTLRQVALRFRKSVSMYNLRRFNKNFNCLIRDLLYADYADIITLSEEDSQLIIDSFLYPCHDLGLKIILRKTNVIVSPPFGSSIKSQNVFVKNWTLKVFDTYSYFGSTISKDSALDDDILSLIQKSRVAFGRFESRVWSDRKINVNSFLWGCNVGRWQLSTSHKSLLWKSINPFLMPPGICRAIFLAPFLFHLLD